MTTRFTPSRTTPLTIITLRLLLTAILITFAAIISANAQESQRRYSYSSRRYSSARKYRRTKAVAPAVAVGAAAAGVTAATASSSAETPAAIESSATPENPSVQSPSAEATATTSEAPQTQPSASLSTPTPAESSQPPMREGDRLTFMEESRPDAAPAPSAGGLIARTFGALLLIVGLIVAVGYGLRRFGGARFGTNEAEAPHLKVMSSVALGDRRSLAVVRFGTRTLLVGSTPQSLTLLASDSDDQDADISDADLLPARSVADLLRDEDPLSLSFDDELSSATNRRPNAREGAHTASALLTSTDAAAARHARGELREGA